MEMQPLTEESLETPEGEAGGLGPTQATHVLTADTMMVEEESASEPEDGLMPLSPSDSVKRYSVPQPGDGAWHLNARHHGKYTKRKSSVKGELSTVQTRSSAHLAPPPCTGAGVDNNGIRVVAELAQPEAVVMETSFVSTSKEAHHAPAPRPSHLHIDEFDVGPLQCRAVLSHQL